MHSAALAGRSASVSLRCQTATEPSLVEYDNNGDHNNKYYY